MGLSRESLALGIDADGSPLYVCRGFVNGSLLPGKMRATWPGCDVTVDGHETSVPSYETLVAEWLPAQAGAIPDHAFAVGNESGAPVYACRATDPGGSLQVGKIKSGFTGCAYPYGGLEINATSYSVLTVGAFVSMTTVARASGAAVPVGAVPAGVDNDGSTLYSCAAPFQGATAVGKTKAAWNGCDVSWGGREYFVSGAHVLTAVNVQPTATMAPSLAGHDGNINVGVCTVPYAGGIQVGRYARGAGCKFGWGGGEVTVTTGASTIGWPSVWTAIGNGTENTAAALDFTTPALPPGMPLECTAGAINKEPVWACPTAVDARIPSKIGWDGYPNDPKCIVNDKVITPPAGASSCEVIYTVAQPESASPFFGVKSGWELVWDHDFAPAADGKISCDVMGCGGACPVSQDSLVPR